jgi:3-oxoacyl-[acyl-carrier protein] reductase
MTTTIDRPSSVVVVSGGSRGIGRAIVDALVSRGDRVATFSRSSWPGDVPAPGRDPGSGELLWQPVDATDGKAVRRFVHCVEERWGRIDALVNNAGVAVEGVLAMTREEDMQQMLEVNVKGSILLAKECVRRMLVQGGGSIINISSIIAERGFTGLSVYAATKGALTSFTRSLARELGPRQIRVNTLAPGFVETEMSASLDDRQRQQIVRRTPLGRLATVDDIVPVVDFLLSPASRFITGQTIVVDGGASV